MVPRANQPAETGTTGQMLLPPAFTQKQEAGDSCLLLLPRNSGAILHASGEIPLKSTFHFLMKILRLALFLSCTVSLIPHYCFWGSPLKWITCTQVLASDSAFRAKITSHQSLNNYIKCFVRYGIPICVVNLVLVFVLSNFFLGIVKKVELLQYFNMMDILLSKTWQTYMYFIFLFKIKFTFSL